MTVVRRWSDGKADVPGSIVALVTPFRDGKVDEARLKAWSEFQIAGERTASCRAGTTGESPTLTTTSTSTSSTVIKTVNAIPQ
jgi:dihydrodipicolinate synthase/N-acetylneuraminate lyase